MEWTPGIVLSYRFFIGCDTVSSFGGRGKKSAWKIWQVFPDITEAFEHLLMEEINDSMMSVGTICSAFVGKNK